MVDVGDTALAALALTLGGRLREKGISLATAESCTGGWVAKAITDIAGSSAWFERGFVTYSNQAKCEMLGVAAATLDAHGAVSEQAAREMAAGALRNSTAGIAVAISGIAGPGGGTADKPVGTVWFAWAAEGGLTRTEQACFPGDREAVRRQAVVRALQGTLDALDH